MELELWSGLLWIWEKETDYIFWWEEDIKELLNERNINLWQPKYEYNQGAEYETRNYCTIFSAITELSYLWNRQFSVCEMKCIADKMIKDWKLNPNTWAYLSDAIDYTRRWWNENFPDKKVLSYRISYLNKELRNYLTHDNVRLTQLGYRTSQELNRELQTKGFASKKDYPKWWWHAVSFYGLNIIDNYKWRNKFNRYSFEYFEDLIKNKVIYETWYIFIKK